MYQETNMIQIPNRKLSTKIINLIMISSLLLLSCSNEDKSKTNDEILYTRLASEPNTLNPILTTDAYSSSIQGLIFNGLFTVDSELNIIPELATTYNIDETNTIYTVTINSSVKWHDGKPLTADDIKYTYETYLSPSTNTVYRSNFIIDNKPIKINKQSTYSVQFVLPKPFAPFLARLTTSIIAKHQFSSENINQNPWNRNPVGTGPFVLDKWATGQFIKLKKNTHYFKSEPKIDAIISRFIPNDLTAIVSLENKEIDESQVKPKDLKALENDPHLTTYSYQQMAYIYIGFNLTKKPFDSAIFREAFARAINKELIVKKVLMNQGSPAELPNHPISWAYPPKSLITTFPYSPVKSMELLKKDGYKLNSQTQFFEKNNQTLEFTLILTKGNTVRENAAKIIQQYLKKVGIKMNIRLLEFQSLVTILKEPSKNKNFDAALLGWSLGIDPDGYSIWHSSQFPSGFNFIGYNNSKVDALIIKGRQETDINSRKKIYHELYQHITRDIPYIFLFYENTLHTVNNRVMGLSKPSPAGIFLHMENIKVTP